MSCPCTFPETVSFQCAAELVSLVRSGELLHQKATALKHAFCLGGSIVNQFAGEPEPMAANEEQAQLEQKDLKETAEFVGSNLPTEEGLQPVGLNPLVVAALKRLVLLAIQEVLSA